MSGTSLKIYNYACCIIIKIFVYNLRNCLSSPKLNYTLRASPCAVNPRLTIFDELLRKAICSIANVNLTESQWLQASLPIRIGGLGVRSVSSLAPSAFLASAAGTSALQELILSSISTNIDVEVSRTQVQWSTLCKLNCPIGMMAHNQQSWDSLVTQTVHSELLANSSSRQDKARLLAVSAPHRGDWLKALPQVTS